MNERNAYENCTWIVYVFCRMFSEILEKPSKSYNVYGKSSSTEKLERIFFGPA